MNPERSNHFLALVAGGIFASVILASGICFPHHKSGGMTQIGRHATVAFEDGTTMDLSESETDLAVWKRRRFAGGATHDFQQIFIMADGREMEVPAPLSNTVEDGHDLSTGDRLISTADLPGTDDKAPLDKQRGIDEVLNLRLDGSYRVASANGADENRVYIDVIDSKDGVVTPESDGKDVRSPAPAVAAAQALEAQRAEMLWTDTGTLYGDYGIMMFGGNALTAGMAGSSSGNGGSVSSPPIGAAVPEPSALALVVVAGGLGLAHRARQRRKVAA